MSASFQEPWPRPISGGAGSRRWFLFDLDDHLDLDRGIARKPRHADRRAGMLSDASPKTSTIKSENPFTTLGWSLKPSAELTIPRTLTMRLTRSRLPSAVRIFPSMINPACRADW